MKSLKSVLIDGKLPKYVDFLVNDTEARSQPENELMVALRHGLNTAVESFGASCVALVKDELSLNQGYRARIIDREKREHAVSLSFVEMIQLGEAHGEQGMFRRILDLAVERAKQSLMAVHDGEN